jgi:hypothetical protein
MVRSINPENWKGIAPAFSGDVVWLNYPAELPKKDVLAGITHPDKWGHFRKGHKIGLYNHIWRKIERICLKENIAYLKSVYGEDDLKLAKQITGWQKLNFCYYWHNLEGMRRAVEQIVNEAVEDALLPYKAKTPRPGRPKTKRAYHSRNNLLSLKDLYD